MGKKKPVAIVSPINSGEVIELGARTFRKEVLRVGKINYKMKDGKTALLDFTPDYLDGLVSAFRAQAFDAVPLVFADKDNRHTQDVDRIRGDVLGFERNGNKLMATVHAHDDKSAELIRSFPRLGVSARIEQPLSRSDGQVFPAAIHHVLATANPVVTGLDPWEPVDLAVGGDVPVIDLSTYNFADEFDEDDTHEENPMPEEQVPALSADDVSTLAAFAAQIRADKAAAEAQAASGLPSDAELERIANDLFSAEEEREPVAVGLSREAQDAIELSQQRADTLERQVAALAAERDQASYARLVTEMADEYGIPPRIVEMAKPLLMGPAVIELSNGEGEVSPGGIVVEVMKEIGKQIKMLDLSKGAPVFEERHGQADAVKEARTEAQTYISQYGLN